MNNVWHYCFFIIFNVQLNTINAVYLHNIWYISTWMVADLNFLQTGSVCFFIFFVNGYKGQGNLRINPSNLHNLSHISFSPELLLSSLNPITELGIHIILIHHLFTFPASFGILLQGLYFCKNVFHYYLYSSMHL